MKKVKCALFIAACVFGGKDIFANSKAVIPCSDKNETGDVLLCIVSMLPGIIGVVVVGIGKFGKIKARLNDSGALGDLRAYLVDYPVPKIKRLKSVLERRLSSMGDGENLVNRLTSRLLSELKDHVSGGYNVGPKIIGSSSPKDNITSILSRLEGEIETLGFKIDSKGRGFSIGEIKEVAKKIVEANKEHAFLGKKDIEILNRAKDTVDVVSDFFNALKTVRSEINNPDTNVLSKEGVEKLTNATRALKLFAKAKSKIEQRDISSIEKNSSQGGDTSVGVGSSVDPVNSPHPSDDPDLEPQGNQQDNLNNSPPGEDSPNLELKAQQAV